MEATETPESHDFFGLCNAWSRGSDNGQANKHDAAGFQGLIKAAGADDQTGDDRDNSVKSFCEGVTKPGGTPTPTAAGSATSTPRA